MHFLTNALTIDSSSITTMLSELSLSKLLPTAVVLVVGLMAAKLLIRLFERGMTRSKLDPSLHGFVRAAFRIALYALVVLIAAGTIGFDVSSLVAVLSIISLAISLAVQGTLANIAGGMMVLSTHPFRVGDYVEIGGVEGTVKDIRLYHTQLLTIDNKEIFVPNSEVSSSKISNFTAEGTRRLDLCLSAAYSCAIDEVRAALLKACDHPQIAADPAPEVLVNHYGDSSIEYLLRLWCPSDAYWTVNFYVLEQVKHRFDEAGLQMTYPHLNVHVDCSNEGGTT